MTYTLPEPALLKQEGRKPFFTADQMQAAYQAGAASRDAAYMEGFEAAKHEVRDAFHTEIEALRADAESWRKYKARKDAVIAAGMGRNPLREDV